MNDTFLMSAGRWGRIEVYFEALLCLLNQFSTSFATLLVGEQIYAYFNNLGLDR